MAHRTIVEEAADMLGILASQDEWWIWFVDDLPGDWRPGARIRAKSAYTAALELDESRYWREDYAEAEAMLHTEAK